MKRLFTIFAIMFFTGVLCAQSHYQFRTDAPQGFSVEYSSASKLSLHYAIPELGLADVEDGGAKGQEIILKGCFASNAEGKPNLPFENRYIAVPQGASVNIIVKEKASRTLDDIQLLPAAPLQMNNEDKRPDLKWDMDVFGNDADYPASNASIAQTTQIRGLDVVLLSVTPFRYNPVRKTLEVIYDMDIEISFEGGNGQFGDSRYRNPAWDGILRDLVINSDMLPEAHYHDLLNEAIRNREEGCEYLIIAPDDSAFLAWADTLKQFRLRQGILTKVASTAECGGNAPDSIRNYILNAYNNWAIPPAAVLLFGGNHSTNPDFGLIPYIYRSPVSWYTSYLYPTDNPIADMNGDSIPDVVISRMTVLNAEECQQMVQKTIQFELNPPIDPHYYDHPVVNSGYQETKWFAITAQVTNNFMRDKLGKHPSNLYMKYYYESNDPTPPDSIWSTAANTAAALDYFGPNGAQYIPSSIGYLDNWIDMEDKMPFRNAVNEESFLTFYRDHSNPNWWPCSDIRSNDVALFRNKIPTLLFSIGCSTNHYWDNWSYDGIIADMFLHANSGAIGSLGTNTVTYSQFNDLTTWGMFDYFWPEYMPTLGTQSAHDFNFPSYALVAGKLFLAQQAFLPYQENITQVDKTLNLFSFLGETYLNIHTEVPQPIDFADTPYQPNNDLNYRFKAEEGVTVCLSNEEGIIAVARSTGQDQAINLPQMEIGDRFTVTLTKLNRIREQHEITVFDASKIFVYLKDFTINDQDGNGQVDYNETASIDIELQNISLLASEGSEITLESDSPYIEILQGTAHCPHLAPDSICRIANAFQFKLKGNVPDQTRITLLLRFDEGGNTHIDPIVFTANAPVIAINPEFRPTTESGEPSTHIEAGGKSFLTFNIKNNGRSKIDFLSTDLVIKAPFVSVAAPDTLYSLLPNEALPVTYEINADPNENVGAWIQMQFTVSHKDGQSILDTIVQYGGLFEGFEADTLNQEFNWAINSNNFWTYDGDAYEGQRCMKMAIDDSHYFRLASMIKNSTLVEHDSKTSFRYQSSHSRTFKFTDGVNETMLEGCEEWTYKEIRVPNRHIRAIWILQSYNPIGDTLIAKIDDIYFPPMHRAIAYAGDKKVSCADAPIALSQAYAYDYDSIRWTTDGDGLFDFDTIANPTYLPGSQDQANNEVTLTLYAFHGNDTIASTTQIQLMDEITLTAIVGDSIVNKFSQPLSHYSIDYQEGVNYIWSIEPASAGTIYTHGDKIDIVWNQQTDDTEVTLSVTADNGCDTEPATKKISIVGYSTPEWSAPSFSLFPNPTDGKVNMVMGNGLQGRATVEVYNLMGELMMTRNVGQLRQGETVSLDLGRLVSGLYIVKLSTENGSCSKKVSVK